MTTLVIDWNAKLTAADWADYLKHVSRTNVIQTWPYARAIRDKAQQGTRFGLIRVNGAEAGLVQIQEISLWGLVHFVFLDRGPLWFGERYDEAFFAEFQRQFPPRFNRRRRIIPEIPATGENRTMMERLGYRYKSRGYRSAWLDLRPDAENIRKNLKKKWRNALSGAERRNLECDADETLRYVPALLDAYIKDRRARNYPGPSPKMVGLLCRYFAEQGDMLLLRALKQGRVTAWVLFLVHGTSATYQLGIIDAEGRQNKAHHFLLWNGIGLLKERGVNWLDLGGINEDTAEGVTVFKSGTGGEVFELAGVYR